MRNFGAVSPKFWNGNTGRSLRNDRDAQVLACYLMTCPLSHQSGIYYLPMTMIAHETGIPFEGASKVLRRLENEQFSVYSAETEWVWVREMALWQIGEPTSDADKRVIGVQNYYDQLPALPFLADFFDRYERTYRLKIRRENSKPAVEKPKDLGRGFEGASKPHGSHTHTQSDTQEDTQERGVGKTKSADTAEREAVQRVFGHWQETWKHPNAKLDRKRDVRIRARLKEGFSAEQLCNAIAGFKHSPWHTGTDPKGHGVIYDGLETLLRDTAQVEKGLELFAHPPSTPASNGNGSAAAYEAWERALKHCTSGGYRKSLLGDERVDAVVRYIGGYPAIAMADDRRVHELKNRFLKAFREGAP